MRRKKPHKGTPGGPVHETPGRARRLPVRFRRSGYPRDAVDLDVDALAGRRGLDGGAGGLCAFEVLLEHAVEDGKIVHAAQEDAHLDHVLDGRPSASSTARTLSRVTRVCSARSGETISLVAGSSGPCPETKRNCPHLTPWAMGDSVPSENPVLGADFVYTTSGFMRTCLPVPSGGQRCPPGTARRPALRPAPHGEVPRRGPRSPSRTGAPPSIPRAPRGRSCPSPRSPSSGYARGRHSARAR